MGLTSGSIPDIPGTTITSDSVRARERSAASPRPPVTSPSARPPTPTSPPCAAPSRPAGRRPVLRGLRRRDAAPAPSSRADARHGRRHRNAHADGPLRSHVGPVTSQVRARVRQGPGPPPGRARPGAAPVAQIVHPLAALEGCWTKHVTSPRGELMSAESSLTAVAVVRALLDEDTEGLAVLLPDGPPGARPRARSQPGQPDSPLGQGCRPGRGHHGRRVPGQDHPALDGQPEVIPGW